MSARRHRLLVRAACVLAAVLPATALADDTPTAASCVRTQSIDDWRPLDQRSIVVRTSPAKSYKVTFFNSCREMKWALFARVESRPGICLSRGDKIVVGRHGFADRCIIDKIEALPPKGEAAPASY
jgi:hypothetical protein